MGSSRAQPTPLCLLDTCADVEQRAIHTLLAGGHGEVGLLNGEAADVASCVALLCSMEAELGVGWAPCELEAGGGTGQDSGFGIQAGGAQHLVLPVLQPCDAGHGPRLCCHQLAPQGHVGARCHPQLGRLLAHLQGSHCWEQHWGHHEALGMMAGHVAFPEAPQCPTAPLLLMGTLGRPLFCSRVLLGRSHCPQVPILSSPLLSPSCSALFPPHVSSHILTVSAVPPTPRPLSPSLSPL